MSKIVMNMKWDNVTPEQYEAVRNLVDWEGNRPKGGNFHVASFGDGAMHVTDIWDSADDFNNFVQTRLMPGVQEVGLNTQPEVHIYPLHAVYLPEPAELV